MDPGDQRITLDDFSHWKIEALRSFLSCRGLSTTDSDMDNASSIMDESSSSFLLNEDSISSMDIDINALEKVSPALPGEPQKKTQFPMEDDEDGDDHPRTIILANSQDKFVLDQDVCKSCGSFGLGEEGKLIVCTQCGQCYHPYCASVKVTKVILQKGWRCLDCTVCEGCGKPHDEGRLLLCDECDIRFHIYCLDPPLDHVPKGTWKCKWCVMCVNCGTTTPGFGCNWQNDYTQCGPCRSKIDCPVCLHKYHEDEMIIQCLQCNRWLHAQCDGLHPEDDMERAADYDYQCLFCRPKTGKDGPSVQEVKKLWSLERGTGYTVGKVSHFNVTDTDIRSLYGTTCRWVTDQVMDAYLACIVQREVEKGNHVTMYPSQTMKSIVEGTFSIQKCRQKLKLWECSTVIGAVFQNCHWTLVIIDLRSRILTFMNPKQEGRSQLDEINRNWCAYIEERRQIYKEVKLEGSSWSVQTWKHSRQTDAFNCGVYCLIFADRYFLKEPLTNFTNDSLSRAREEIAASLMMQNVWQEKCCPTCGFNTYDEEVIRCEKCFSHFHKTEACVGLENMARRTFTCQICSKKCVEETKRKLETHEDQIVEENENMKKVKSTTEEVKVMEDVQSHGTCLNNAEITATAPRNSFFTNRKVFLKDCCPKCAKTIEDEESIKCSTCRRSFHFKPFCIEEDLADIKEAEYFKCRLCRINFWENQEEDHHDLRKHPLKKRKRSSFLHSDIHGRYQQEERKGSSKDEPFSGPKERHVSLKSFYEKINQITCKIINCSNNDCKEEDHKRHHQFILDIDMFLQKERRNYGFGNDYIDAEQQEILIQEMLQLFLLKKHTPGRIYSGWWMSIVGLENNKILESIFKSNILSAKDYIIHVLVKEIIIYLIMDTTGICYQMADKRCRSTE